MNTNDHLKAIVFDVDGTLFDTLPSLANAANETLVQAGLRAVPPQSLRAALSAGLRPLFHQALALQAAAPESAQQLEEDYLAHYTRRWLADATLFPGVAECLTTLRSAGLKLGLCTNRDRSSTEVLLAATGLTGHFELIVGLGDAPLPKPAADPLLLAIELMGLSTHQVLFVGDSLMDARCAEQAQVQFAAHRAGYASQATDLLPQILGFDRYEQLTQWVCQHLPVHKETSHA